MCCQRCWVRSHSNKLETSTVRKCRLPDVSLKNLLVKIENHSTKAAKKIHIVISLVIKQNLKI